MTRVDKACVGGAAILFGVCLGALLGGCATAKTCAQPLTGQAIQDGAAVLSCAATGKTLAACEDAQLAVEAGQITADLLVCGEIAVAAAANGTHTAAK